MKAQPTKEQILTEMQRLRSEYETVRRKTKELGLATTRLYVQIENLPASGTKRTTSSLKV